MAQRNYEHILIDADNTILDFAVCERRILETMAREFGFMPWTVEGEDLTTAYRRINVALTRAKKALVLVGDAAALSSDSVYGRMVEWARG